MTRHRELLESPELAALFPIFADAERVIADPVVRNRGTIGGSLCQADPSEDLTAVCTALDASCVIRGADGERVVAMEDFHRGPYETAVGHDEILTEIRIPVRPNGSSAYAKVERRAGDWAVTSAGAAVWMDGGVIADARVGLAAVGPNTAGIPAISEALRGQQPSEELYAQAGGDRRRELLPGDRQPRDGRLQAAPRRRAHPAHAADRRRAHPGRACRRPADDRRTADMQVTMTVNGETRDARDRGPDAARALPARRARAHRHPLGLRHQQLRHLRGLAGRRAGEDLHGAGRDGRRPRGPHRRGPGAGRRARPGAGGLHALPRPAVRLLHAGHADDRAGAARPRPRPERGARSARRSRARSAGAPATRRSSARCSGPPRTHARPRAEPVGSES